MASSKEFLSSLCTMISEGRLATLQPRGSSMKRALMRPFCSSKWFSPSFHSGILRFSWFQWSQPHSLHFFFLLLILSIIMYFFHMCPTHHAPTKSQKNSVSVFWNNCRASELENHWQLWFPNLLDYTCFSKINTYILIFESESVSCSVMSNSLRPHGLSTGFSRQVYCSALPFPSPRDLPDPRIEPGSPSLQTDSLLSQLTLTI